MGSRSGSHGRAQVLPLSQRPLDIFLIGFFVLNLLVITYVVDIEQITAPQNPDPDGTKCEMLRKVSLLGDNAPDAFGVWEGTYPVWPPNQAVDVIRWYGCNFDPPLIARAAWWRSTIWTDSLLFGPFYAWGIVAYWVGDSRIRIATVAWAAVIMTNVFVIMMEEYDGSTSTPFPVLVSALNVPWFFVPLVAGLRMALQDHPFSRPSKSEHQKRE